MISRTSWYTPTAIGNVSKPHPKFGTTDKDLLKAIYDKSEDAGKVPFDDWYNDAVNYNYKDHYTKLNYLKNLRGCKNGGGKK